MLSLLLKLIAKIDFSLLKLKHEDIIILVGNDIEKTKNWGKKLREVGIFDGHDILICDRNIDIITLNNAPESLKTRMRQCLTHTTHQ